ARLMLEQYREVVLADFEFRPEGERIKEVVCVVAHLLKSGQTIRVWQDQFGPVAPYPIGPDVLFVAFQSAAEIGCHLALGWPVPPRVLDLYPEFIARTNRFREEGTKPPKPSLLSAMGYFGLDCMGASEKRDRIELILRGGPWTREEQADI